MSCFLCESKEFDHDKLPQLVEFYDSGHEWVQLKACPACRQAFLLYGVEIRHVSGSEDDIWTYVVPISEAETGQLLKIAWSEEMRSWHHNAAKQMILSRRRHVRDTNGNLYWSDSATETGLCILPPG